MSKELSIENIPEEYRPTCNWCNEEFGVARAVILEIRIRARCSLYQDPMARTVHGLYFIGMSTPQY
jgi:hypothetical protein